VAGWEGINRGMARCSCCCWPAAAAMSRAVGGVPEKVRNYVETQADLGSSKSTQTKPRNGWFFVVQFDEITSLNSVFAIDILSPSSAVPRKFAVGCEHELQCMPKCSER